VVKAKNEKITLVEPVTESQIDSTASTNECLLKTIARLKRENKVLRDNCEQLEHQIYELLNSRLY
jgi:cell division protein FtsB